MSESWSGFRRRIRVTPAPNAVQAELEDDFHCMSVVVRHDGVKATEIIPDMRRVPWSTCPGAEHHVVETFIGVGLDEFPGFGDKKQNCTHLYDLALLAAAHAGDQRPILYDILITDPVNGERKAEIHCDGTVLLSWLEADFKIIEPQAAAGLRLDKLRPWIDELNVLLREPARLLQWGNILANGRIIPLDKQSDATRMPASCFSFQPERAAIAKRVGLIRDFSYAPGQKTPQPLEGFDVLV